MLSGVCAKMFEIGIISIILLAVGYWVTLWLMGRHNDVLHGDFVHAEDGTEAPEPSDRLFANRPPFPPKPVIKQPVVNQPAINQPAIRRPAIRRPAIPPATADPASARRAAAQPAPAGTPSTPSLSASSASSLSRTDRTDTLQTLLASIKRDLKDASQL